MLMQSISSQFHQTTIMITHNEEIAQMADRTIRIEDGKVVWEVSDMHANRNKKAVKKVEKGMMKANRTRNLFAVFAIVLTTFMITTVFSLGINYMENMELMQVRTAGTSADVSPALPTTEQEQQIKSLDYVKTIGTQYMVGSVTEKNDEGVSFPLRSNITIQPNGKITIRTQSTILTAPIPRRKMKLCCLRTPLHSLELKRRR